MPKGYPRNKPPPAPVEESRSAPELRVVENKSDKTRRLANQRGKQLINYMKLVGNLGRTGYDLASDDAEKLIARLEKEFGFMVEQLRHGAQGLDGDDII